MIKISICGSRGRMGTMVRGLLRDDPKLELAGLIEKQGHKDISLNVEGIEVISSMKDGIKNADVVIDFSDSDTAMKLLEECGKNNKKLVIGTTGFSREQISEIGKSAEKIPILLSPNMSIGVNLVFKVAKDITDRLPDYEKEIIEAHHNKKVDAPSGTALEIARIISKDGDKIISGREGKVGPRQKNEIGMHVVRAGNIVGEHTIMWVNPHERIELIHRAQSREVFACGAVRAAVWLNGQSCGRLYSMEDVLR